MAFMVPLVKNHYDIYARNNPADHQQLRQRPTDNSLFLSATSLAKNGAHPVTKQYRIVISGGKVVPGGKGATGKGAQQPAGAKKANPSAGTKLSQTAAGKLYYRMPSASISLPVPAGRTQGKVVAQKPPKGPTSPQQEPSSPQSVSPPSRPLPHIRRTVRNPLTNRVYSYSVSIPDYVAEEDEEELEESDSENEDEEFDELDIDEDKENQDSLLLFSTSAPAGTGPISSAGTPSPPPPTKLSAKKVKKPENLSMPSSPEAHPTGAIQSGRPRATQRTLSSTTTSSSTSSASNSREYVELLRKFILHLKMLKIGGSKKSNKRNNRSKNNNNNPTDDSLLILDEPDQPRTRKRKDTMEDSNHL